MADGFYSNPRNFFDAIAASNPDIPIPVAERSESRSKTAVAPNIQKLEHIARDFVTT
jgi:hypothetical protein